MDTTYELQLTEDDAAELDIDELADRDPEQAAILLDMTIKNHVADERRSWIIRAKMVYYMKERELWRYHPETFSSIYEYCAQPDIDIAPSVVCDMLAICKFAPHLEAAGIDIWEVVLRAGHSKVRQIIPQIREAHRAGVLKEELGPIVAAIDGMSFREVLTLTGTSGVRTSYELEAIYQETSDGEIVVTFKNLDVDDLEYLTRKAGIKRWFDIKGNRIEPPLNEPELKALKRGA